MPDGVTDSQLWELIDRVPDLLTITSPEGHFAWVSPSWQKIMGWSFEELTSRPFLDFVHPIDRERTALEAAEIFTHGRPAVEFTNRYETSSGEFRWLEWNAILSTDGMILASARDVSDRKQTELEELERVRLMEMTEQLAGVGQWRVDLRTGVTVWSPRVFQIHGLPVSEKAPPLEQGIEAYHEDDRAIVAGVVEQAINHHEGFSFGARIIRPSGEIRYVESQGVPELSTEGETIAIFGIFRDVTESRQMEEAVRRSERMSSIGTMAAGVAHEINNPLSYLMGNLQLIEEELHELAEIPKVRRELLVDMITDAVSGSNRVRKIVDGMRAFSRVGKTDRVVQDPSEAIRAAVSMSEHALRMSATLVLELKHTHLVEIDQTQLVQVLVNLLINAAQAIPQGNASGNRVTVSTRDEGNELLIEVEDTGPGIPAALRDKIFDPFFTTKPVGSGTGLGLSISHTIITQSGGRITADPDATGGLVRVSLPAVTHRGMEAEPAEAEVHPVTTLPRILVVDDEPGVTAMVGRALRNNWRVVSCHSGREALAILNHDHGFDVILCDLMMPEVTGMDVLRHLLANAPELTSRIIFMTGGTLTPDAVTVVEDHDAEVLLKPVDIPELRTRLAQRLDAE